MELNVQIQSPSEVKQLQAWYEEHWQDSEDISEDIIKIISRHAEAWSPFDVYTHSLRELFRNREDSSTVWEETESIIFNKLDQYQKEAYWSLIKIANRFQGAFLCDGVGLGKTFVGLMLIERMVHEKKHVVLFAPKGAKEGVWDPILKKLLPDLETVFFMTGDNLYYVSSSIVKEVYNHGGDVSKFVPEQVLDYLNKTRC